MLTRKYARIGNDHRLIIECVLWGGGRLRWTAITIEGYAYKPSVEWMKAWQLLNLNVALLLAVTARQQNVIVLVQNGTFSSSKHPTAWSCKYHSISSVGVSRLAGYTQKEHTMHHHM